MHSTSFGVQFASLMTENYSYLLHDFQKLQLPHQNQCFLAEGMECLLHEGSCQTGFHLLDLCFFSYETVRHIGGWGLAFFFTLGSVYLFHSPFTSESEIFHV